MKVNRETFIAEYTAQLEYQYATNPEYAYSAARISAPDLASKMYASLRAGTANKDGAAIKATLKKLGIKNTYKAIKEALN